MTKAEKTARCAELMGWEIVVYSEIDYDHKGDYPYLRLYGNGELQWILDEIRAGDIYNPCEIFDQALQLLGEYNEAYPALQIQLRTNGVSWSLFLGGRGMSWNTDFTELPLAIVDLVIERWK